MDMKFLKDALAYGSKLGYNDKALFEEARSAQKWAEIRTQEHTRGFVEEAVSMGEKYLKTPITALPYSLYKLSDDTGSNIEFEREYWDRRRRLNTMAILSLAFGDKWYLELEDIIWAVCDEYTWCLPPHFFGDSTKIMGNNDSCIGEDGNIISHSREHRQLIDLYSAETGFALAEILSLLEDKLAPLVVYRARKEITERVLKPYCELNTMLWWETATMNWAAVCGGSIGAAAMYLIKDESVLTPLLYKVLGTLDCFLAGYGRDGACFEGMSYWWYGFGFYIHFAQLLRQRTGGKIDLFCNDKVREIALFCQKCYLSGGKAISISEASETFWYDPGLVHFLKSRFSEVEIPDAKYKMSLKTDRCSRWSPFIRIFVWSGPDNESSFKEQSYYLEDVKWFISRKKAGTSELAFVAKGGLNEGKRHHDLGSFILHMNGETLLTDLGHGAYDRKYFGPDRYSYFNCGSQGHSVPIIEGRYQGTGAEYISEITSVETSADRDCLTIDLTKAYPSGNLKSFFRDFVFEKEGGGRLVLTDTYQFEEIPSSVTERFISRYEPVISEIGKVKVSGENESIIILYDPAITECKINKTEYERVSQKIINTMEMETVYMIDFDIKPEGTRFSAEFVFCMGDRSNSL